MTSSFRILNRRREVGVQLNGNGSLSVWNKQATKEFRKKKKLKGKQENRSLPHILKDAMQWKLSTNAENFFYYYLYASFFLEKKMAVLLARENRPEGILK